MQCCNTEIICGRTLIFKVQRCDHYMGCSFDIYSEPNYIPTISLCSNFEKWLSCIHIHKRAQKATESNKNKGTVRTYNTLPIQKIFMCSFIHNTASAILNRWRSLRGSTWRQSPDKHRSILLRFLWTQQHKAGLPVSNMLGLVTK